MIKPNRALLAGLLATLLFTSVPALAEKAYLEVTLKIDSPDRAAAGAIYAKYKSPFLKTVPGAKSKELLMRDDDVQVLHGFATFKQAKAYLASELFTRDVVTALKPLLKAAPEVRIYATN